VFLFCLTINHKLLRALTQSFSLFQGALEKKSNEAKEALNKLKGEYELLLFLGFIRTKELQC